ncbi:MAG: RDD family protein [Gammaproteobacteria bacterium]|nr:RDD family protein [Gammaproteobacteria bacterium]
MFCPQCGAQSAPNHRFCARCGTELRGLTPPPAPDAKTPAAPPDLYAGFWPRVGAFAVDGVVVVLACTPLKRLLGIQLEGPAAIPDFFWGSVVVLWLYKAVMESSVRQATLGKLAFDLKVTGVDGERINFWRAHGRNVAQLASAAILFIGFLMPAFTRHRQALHDMIASTLVTRRQYSPEVIDAAAQGRPLPEDGAPVAAPSDIAGAAAPGREPQQPQPARPELPLRLSFRAALHGSNKRAVLENLSDSALEVLLEVKSPQTGAHFSRTFVINPRSYGQIGGAQGWPFANGQLVTVSNPQYRPLVQTVS